MGELWTLVLPLLTGILIGAMFFGGLWWTIQKGSVSSRPALWFVGSFLLRTGLAVTGLYLVAGGHADRLVACLLGFLGARVIVTRLLGRPRATSEQETAHASQS